jgi:hypothetical protein
MPETTKKLAKIAKRKPTKPKSQAQQAKRFVEAAHMLEADHDEAAFEKRLKKIAKGKPADDKPKK